MPADLDELLGGLAAWPRDRDLAGLEGAVLARVARERAARRAMGPAQATAVVLAVAVGLAAGGAAGVGAAKPREVAMLSTELAPSNLLIASR